MRSSGYTEEEWAEHFSNMVDLADMPKERSEIAQYLAANMPPNKTRAPTLVPGELEVGFTEWKVPTLGQRARDPVEAPDGTIWWAGPMGQPDRAHRSDDWRDEGIPVAGRRHAALGHDR